MDRSYVGFARVSSREQEREGFSLEVQEQALARYSAANRGTIIKMFRVAETASKNAERHTFHELVRYVKKHAAELDGILFYKVDRAARNLIDYVELERLESEYGVPFISVSQPTDSNPAGRMMRRTLANMASFFTEQMAVDISHGIAKRVQEGLFPGKAPYGYLNVRSSGRSIVEIDRRAARNIGRIFQLYAYENQTLEGVVRKLAEESAVWKEGRPAFSRTSIHNILNDRAYIGEIQYRGHWYPGKHKPLVDCHTWDRVQSLLGKKGHTQHEMTFAGEFMQCGHCGHAITGEVKRKMTKEGEKSYVYYRCTFYNKPGHPRNRVREAELDLQMLQLFERIKIEDEGIRDWFRAVLASKTKDDQAESIAKRAEVQRQLSLVIEQQDRLLNLRIEGEIEQEAFLQKQLQFRDRAAKLKLDLESLDRCHDEVAETASRVFELSQSLKDKWLSADFAAKRRILEIVLLNCRLDGATLCPTIRKPFDVLAEGLLVHQSGGGGN
jgi:site-specific DNA recombinase